MLHGIGGRTISEAKERLSQDEVLVWAAYMDKRGTLNVGRHVESGAALIAAMLSRINGGKADVSDFTPHEDSYAPAEQTDEQMLEALRSMAQ